MKDRIVIIENLQTFECVYTLRLKQRLQHVHFLNLLSSRFLFSVTLKVEDKLERPGVVYKYTYDSLSHDVWIRDDL